MMASIIDETDGKPIPNSEVTVLNKCTGEVSDYLLDSGASFSFAVECGCIYQMQVSSAGYQGRVITLK